MCATIYFEKSFFSYKQYLGSNDLSYALSSVVDHAAQVGMAIYATSRC